MNRTLENLWYLYQMENTKQSAEEKKLLGAVIEVEDKLYPGLNEEQKELLWQLELKIEEVNANCNKDAFVKGVRFATGFLLDALRKD